MPPMSLSTPVGNEPNSTLVSIITPSYNQGQFIRETIESVLGQDYPDIEYWVIDGGSTDDTVAILRDYEHDPRFHWISERDSGQTEAINKGWARCHGDVLCWLNSDDCYTSPGAVSTQLEVLQRTPDVGLIYGDGIFVDEDGGELAQFPTRDYSYPELLRVNYIMQPTVFVRRAIVEQVGLLDASFRFAMDRDYWLRCSSITKFIYNPQTIATYRLHQHSKTVDMNILLNIDSFGATCKHLATPQGRTLAPKQRRILLASGLLNLAIRAIHAGEVELAIRMVRGASHLNRWDIRYASVLLALVDRRFGWNIQPRLAGVLYFFLNPTLRHNRPFNESYNR